MAKNDTFAIDILETAKTIHLIGIGGIGVSAVARMFLEEDRKVSGSDREKSKITDELKKAGAKIFYTQVASNIPKNVDLVVYSPSIADSNPELRAARKQGVPVLSYPEVLGLISANKYTIAVAGTHGKTTTTAMIAKIMLEAKLEPTVIVGSLVKDRQGKATNFIAGKSRYFVVEACEYRRSFLQINPTIAVITNIDKDHLDYYKDLKEIQRAFGEFVAKIPTDGYLVCDVNDPRLKPVIKKAKCRIINYSALGVGSLAHGRRGKFADEPTPSARRFKLKVPGAHNQSNAGAAYAVAKILKVKNDITVKALENFSGTWRRFEYVKKLKTGAKLYNDYGHHPTEISATLQAARSITKQGGRVVVVFQPHLYSRTKLLLKDFAESFVPADQVIVTDIYAAREKKDLAISAQTLINEINQKKGQAIYLKKFQQIADYLNTATNEWDTVILQGAGDIVKVGEIC